MAETKLIRDNHLWTRDTVKNVSGNVTLDIAGDIILDANGGCVDFKDNDVIFAELAVSGGSGRLKLIDDANSSDYLSLYTGVAGRSYLKTNDSSGANGAHLDIVPEGSLTLKGQAIKLNPTNSDILFGTTDAESIVLDTNGSGGAGGQIILRSILDTDDQFSIDTTTLGATTITTVDDGGANADLTFNIDGFIDINSATGEDITLDPGGDVIVSGADVKIDATKKLYLDGGTETYIYEASDDSLRIAVGGDIVLQLDENSADGNSVLFKTSCAGFSKVVESFSDDSIIGSAGSDDTHIDFRHTNKISLAVTGNITNLNLIFPTVSGNFLLLLTYDGDHTITNYKAYASDEAAAGGDADVFWPGGNKPDNTASGIDILSFFWDATIAGAGGEKAYGVASLAFATP